MIAILQARINSTRLNSKSVKNIYKNFNSTDIILDKLLYLHKKKFINKIFIATGPLKKNKFFQKYEQNNIKIYFGSEKNVQSRFIQILKNEKSKFCIRLTADNPFVDVSLIKILIKKIKKDNLNYAAFQKNQIPYGSGVEIFNTNYFLKLAKIKKNKFAFEHVTNDILKGKKSLFLTPPQKYKKLIKMRLTIDNIEDYLFAKFLCKKNNSCHMNLFQINKFLLNI